MENQNIKTIDPSICPLCNGSNRCGNLESSSQKAECWCRDPEISFPEALLAKLPADSRNKACICRNCVVDYLAEVAL